MGDYNVFVSVGATATEKQEIFVRAVEERLRSEGINPHTVGRNTFSAVAPFEQVTELLDKCHGAVVIALERTYFPLGLEKRGGPKEAKLSEVRYPSPWNQIEAGMAFTRGLPLMVIVEEGCEAKDCLSEVLNGTSNPSNRRRRLSRRRNSMAYSRVGNKK
jgi:hypothetical protein